MKVFIDYTALQVDIDKIYNKNCFHYFSLSMRGSFDGTYPSVRFLGARFCKPTFY